MPIEFDPQKSLLVVQPCTERREEYKRHKHKVLEEESLHLSSNQSERKALSSSPELSAGSELWPLKPRQAESLYDPTDMGRLARFHLARFQPEFQLKEEKNFKEKARLELKALSLPPVVEDGNHNVILGGWEHRHISEKADKIYML
jgi:hypothetical protein